MIVIRNILRFIPAVQNDLYLVVMRIGTVQSDDTDIQNEIVTRGLSKNIILYRVKMCGFFSAYCMAVGNEIVPARYPGSSIVFNAGAVC